MSAPGNKQRRADGGRNDWQTPPELFKLLDDEFHFDIDAAASPENALCKRFFSEEDSAFDHELSGGWRVFCNPPYGEPEFPCKAPCKKKKCEKRGHCVDTYQTGLIDWINLFIKWGDEGSTVVALVPSASDVWWWKVAYVAATEVRLLSGRVRFIDPATSEPDGSNTTGSTVFVFGGEGKPWSWRESVWLWDWRADL